MVPQRCPLWIPPLLIAVTIVGVADGNNNNNMHSVIYRGCSDAEYNQGSAYASNLNALLDSIVSQGASAAYFYNDSVGVGVGEGNSAAYGVFQCRGDLSNEECLKCKQSIVPQAALLCGSTVAARVQLRGCYLRYENSDFFGAPEQHLVYKACSPETTTDPDFFNRRDNVLTGLEEGSFSSNNFRVTSNGDSKAGPPVYGYAQCEGDLSWPECADCVFKAATDVKDICAASVGGQVYLQKCYVTYSQGDDAHAHGDMESKHVTVTAKTVAIVIGGVAAVIFTFIFLLFLKSLCRDNGWSPAPLPIS